MDEPTPRPQFPWKTAILSAVLVILCAMLLVVFLLTGRGVKTTVDRGLDLAHEAVANAPEALARFKTGRITHTFRESLPEVTSTRGNVLELATTQVDESFKSSDARTIAWDWVYLGTTVAEIRVPVTFRYHLRLSDPWRLAARDHVCLVLAPPIRPSLPPAIHTDRMETRAESGWARFDKNERLAELQRSITATLERRAQDAHHLAAVREACRQSVAAFVKQWLMREDFWRQDRFAAIVVLFPDEVSLESDEALARELREPTIRLE